MQIDERLLERCQRIIDAHTERVKFEAIERGLMVSNMVDQLRANGYPEGIVSNVCRMVFTERNQWYIYYN